MILLYPPRIKKNEDMWQVMDTDEVHIYKKQILIHIWRTLIEGKDCRHIATILQVSHLERVCVSERE